MSPSLDAFIASLKTIPEHYRLAQIKEYIRNAENAEERSELEVLLILSDKLGVIHEPENLIITIHGIRTHAFWQNTVERLIKQKSKALVFNLGYEYFDAFRFWLPFLRRSPIERILDEIRVIIANHPNATIAIVAHSFGSYIVSEILSKEDIKLTRVQLCGSIISEKYPWYKVKHRLHGTVINDVGVKDIWPIMAKAFSWGYGASGTFGFKRSYVENRYFDYSHSDYMHTKHISRYWVPFLLHGQIKKSTFSVENYKVPYWMSLISFLPVKTIIVAIFICLFYRYEIVRFLSTLFARVWV